MSLAALLFDVDGTLADTEPDGHRPAYNAAFRDFGLEWYWSEAEYRDLLLVTGGPERLNHYLDRSRPAPPGGHARAIDEDRDAWINALHACKARHFQARLKRGLMPLRDGVARLWKEAADAGVIIAIVTNASRNTLLPFIEYALGPALAASLRLTVCRNDVAARKPAPDSYTLACTRLGCDPADCIAIEDSQAGLRAAASAGVPTVVTVNADTRDQCFDGAQAVVDSLGEPGAPATVLHSPGFAFDYVDLGVLRRIVAGLRPPLRAVR